MYVGRPAPVRIYDIGAQRAWLEQAEHAVSALVYDRDWPLGPIPPKFFEMSVVRENDSLDWRVSLELDAAATHVSTARNPKLPSMRRWHPTSEDVGKDFEAAVEQMREGIEKVGDDVWAVFTTNIPEGMDYGGFPGFTGNDSLTNGGYIRISLAAFDCPTCPSEIEDFSRFCLPWGLLACRRCGSILEDSENHDLPYPDGVARLDPDRFPCRVVQECLIMAKREDSRFHSLGPYSSWIQGSMRFYGMFIGARLVGFSAWNNESGLPCLRLIWVHPEARRKGYGRHLLDAEAIDADEFGVEAPSEAFHALLDSTGYRQSKMVYRARTS